MDGPNVFQHKPAPLQIMISKILKTQNHRMAYLK
jgi:hypothetical protein